MQTIVNHNTKFIAGDFSAIEARVLLWLADDKKGLKTFYDGRCIYLEMASEIFKVPVDSVNETQRSLGKNTILGCGFGMGGEKFHTTCNSWGVKTTPQEALQAVKTYRQKFNRVVNLWYRTDEAAIFAVKNPGRQIRHGKVIFLYDGNFLYCKLPSGRLLYYYKPEVIKSKTPWETVRDQLTYMGVNSKTHKWERLQTYGGKLVENITQAVARDLMASAINMLENHNYKVIFTAHDEIVCEIFEGNICGSTLNQYLGIMCQTPKWADGIPVEAKGWIGTEYRK